MCANNKGNIFDLFKQSGSAVVALQLQKKKGSYTIAKPKVPVLVFPQPHLTKATLTYKNYSSNLVREETEYAASQNMDSSKLSKLVKVAIANLDALVGMPMGNQT